MCHRQLQCTRFACGHEEPVAENKIDCRSETCRYSCMHPRDCPRCTATCVQW
ncbi:hypothetical protein CONPUDRAFT_67894 [Coniophora puteana RWD-64-598 SS2]|uniref:Uncharacterized protein n=1 Tax=Coniophora puteana (strain RWD-64-598) TaxID=741705 RepID=R7SD27_CONPW|nr:uncharacterized protein CONPUDRAFT_67894 [Coniophora puteana RWD-64-598 SS2]EIW74068.1 hypothetical protein CONPUDRAFT_67894 [Coniophora puteana RWD-64-598 SS2]